MSSSTNLEKPFATTGCEVAFDELSRQLYATDASIYRVEPVGVAYPREGAHVRSVIERAASAGLPIIPRGAGTGLAGGAIGNGVIMDFSRHHREISNLDLDRRIVRVGSGVVLDQLNAYLRPHGYRFGPDVATSSRATLGGMIANNSSGSHVPVYGTTRGHVRSTEVVFADGRLEVIGAGRESPSLEKERQRLRHLIQPLQSEIEERLPAGFLKGWPGYGIDAFLREPDHLQHLISGSEGTLAAIVSAELDIVPLPSRKGLGLCFFHSISEAMQATVELLELKPAAIEHIDRILLDQTRGKLAFQKARDLLGLEDRCESILVVEFFDEVEERLAALSQKKLGLGIKVLKTDSEMNLIWALRKAGLSLLTGCQGSAKPVAGIEDVAVRPEQLPGYVAGLRSVLASLDLEASFYGHAASGLLHVRPVLDLHSSSDLVKYRQLADEVSALTLQFKGSLAAEHGVGMARTEFMEAHLGKNLLGVMRAIKDLFDPHDRMNPGKIVGQSEFRIDRNLRLGEDYELRLPFEPRIAFAAKDKSFIGNLEQCNGCGGCRKNTPTMCPTFIATGEESMSTRGRANTIRSVLESGGSLESEALEHALEHCLGCKACSTECPSNVDLTLLKAELTHARHQRHGMPLVSRMLSSIDGLGRWACLAPGLANASLRWPWLRRLLKRVLGITDQRPLPNYTRQRFDHWFARRQSRGNAPPPDRGPVILWDDTFVRYHEPEIGMAALTVLEAAGFEVHLPRQRRCCGRPAFSQGNLDQAARQGRHNLAVLRKLQEAILSVSGANRPDSTEGDIPIIFLEPSCYTMFISDYGELDLPGAGNISSQCHLFEVFIEDLLREDPEALKFGEQAGGIAIHVHCHAKSSIDPGRIVSLAKRLPGRGVELLASGCCGMAGAFGAMESKYALSLKVAQPLIEGIERQPEDTVVVASGTSCRHQIEHLTPRVPKHMALLLAESLVPAPNKCQ